VGRGGARPHGSLLEALLKPVIDAGRERGARFARAILPRTGRAGLRLALSLPLLLPLPRLAGAPVLGVRRNVLHAAKRPANWAGPRAVSKRRTGAGTPHGA